MLRRFYQFNSAIQMLESLYLYYSKTGNARNGHVLLEFSRGKIN